MHVIKVLLLRALVSAIKSLSFTKLPCMLMEATPPFSPASIASATPGFSDSSSYFKQLKLSDRNKNQARRHVGFDAVTSRVGGLSHCFRLWHVWFGAALLQYLSSFVSHTRVQVSDHLCLSLQLPKTGIRCVSVALFLGHCNCRDGGLGCGRAVRLSCLYGLRS